MGSLRDISSKYISTANIAYSYVCTLMMMIVAGVSQAQVTIMTQPMNVTVCLSQNTTANFTCVVDVQRTGITSAGWQLLLVDEGFYTTVVGRLRHMLDPRSLVMNTGTIITETLTITDVSVGDNGTKYRCRPVDDVISDVVTLTVIAPPAITAIEVNEICTNDFNVSWTPASNEEGLFYDVILLQSSMSNGIRLDSTMDTSYNFTGLTPNTAYNITVASVLNSCSGTPNTIMLTTVTVQAGVPQSVSNLRYLTRTRNTITVVWDPADSPNCGPVLYYNVTIVNSVDDNDRDTTDTSGTRAEFSNLIIGTNYTIIVAAVNRAGAGLTSAIILATLTDEEDLSPTISITVIIDEICINDFTISWTSTSSDTGLSYNVILSPPSQTLTTMNTSYSFTGLIPNVTYNVTVVASSNSAIGIPAVIMVTTLTVETGRAMGVLNLRSTQRTTDTITVAWDPTDSLNCGPALYYIVTIRNLAISCDINSFDLTVPRAEFHDLINNVAYTISVAAVNRAGVGMETTINVTTLAVAVATSDTSQDSLSNGVVAVITAVICCVVSIVITAIITFVISAHYHKRKYSNKQTAVTQPIVSRTGVIEYEEIKKTSPDNMAMTTNPSYDVAMTGNPAYGHNVKKIDQGSDYYN